MPHRDAARPPPSGASPQRGPRHRGQLTEVSLSTATDESPKGLQGDGRHSAQSDQTQQHTQTTRQHTHTHQAGQRMQEKRVHGASRSWRVHGASRSWRGSWPGRTRSLPSSDRLRLRLLGVVIALGDARGHGDMMSRRSSIQQCSSQGEAHERRHARRLQAITPGVGSVDGRVGSVDSRVDGCVGSVDGRRQPRVPRSTRRGRRRRRGAPP